jgi:hypothetical protein
MSAQPIQALIAKLEALPPEQRAQVEDFVDFLQSRESDRQLSRSVTQISEPAFKDVWDNPDDGEYDRL